MLSLSRDIATGENERRYFLHIYSQPTYRYLIYRLFHNFHHFMESIPPIHWAMDRLPSWRWRHYSKGFSLPLCAEVDCKCYALESRERVEIHRVEVDREWMEKHCPGLV